MPDDGTLNLGSGIPADSFSASSDNPTPCPEVFFSSIYDTIKIASVLYVINGTIFLNLETSGRRLWLLYRKVISTKTGMVLKLLKLTLV